MENQEEQQPPIPNKDNTPPNQKPIFYRHDSFQSFKSIMLKLVLRWYDFKSAKALLRKLETGKPNRLEMPVPPAFMKKDLEITSLKILKRNVYRLEPQGTKTSNKIILYLHGGGYFDNSTEFHWKFIRQIVLKAGCTVIHPDYPLGPKNSHAECFQFMDDLYKNLLLEINPNDLIFMGDSAGAGLALAFSQKLRAERLPLPSQVILLSPWLDVSCSNPEMRAVDQNDPMINIEVLQRMGRLWAKDIDVNDPLVSPANGDLEGLPKITIFTSTYDVLEPDVRKFKKKCEEKGIGINYFEYPKMVHDWFLFGLPESKMVLQQIKPLL